MAQRPPLGRWLLYAFGFRLPERYDEWVFHDLNSRGWAIREVARVMLVAALPIIGIMFLPAGIGLRLMTASFLVFGPAVPGCRLRRRTAGVPVAPAWAAAPIGTGPRIPAPAELTQQVRHPRAAH